jgi:transglutaminase-like putative cysteine protease
MMHLAITFMPGDETSRARYAQQAISRISTLAPDPTPMDFSAFLEVYSGGKWWPLDARHNVPASVAS